MAEIILEPTALSKVIPLKFKINDVDVPKTTQLSTNKQFNTTDTDAWFTFELDGLASTSGTYDLTLINLDDKSIFHHDNVLFAALPFHYKLNSSDDITLNEIRHAGRWLGQLVVTMGNGDTTSRQFGFNISGHILDGQDAQVILLSDYQALINTINLAKDDLAQYNVEYAALLVDIAAAEDARVTAYNQLLADQQANIEAFDVALDEGIVAANLATKLQTFEATNNSRLLSAERQLEQVATKAELSAIATPKAVTLAAQMTDVAKIYVYAGVEGGYISGNWYYHNGTAWVSGGIYQASGIGDGAIKINNIQNPTVIVGKNKFNKLGNLTERPTPGTYATTTYDAVNDLLVTTGLVGVKFGAGQKITVKKNTIYSISLTPILNAQGYALQTEAGANVNYHTSLPAGVYFSESFNTGENEYLYFLPITSSMAGVYGLQNVQIEEGASATTYENYTATIERLFSSKIADTQARTDILALDSRVSSVETTSAQITGYVIGKNLFDKATMMLQDYAINNLGVIGTISGWIGAKIPLDAETTYSFKHDNDKYLPNSVGMMAYLSATDQIISTVDMSTLPTSDSGIGKKFTTPANTAYVFKNVLVLTNDYRYTLQIELGSSFTKYEAYEKYVTELNNLPVKDTQLVITPDGYIDKNTVFMGDSITADPTWWTVNMLARLSFKHYLNLARSGATWSHTADTVYDITSTTGSTTSENVIWNQVNKLIDRVTRGVAPTPEVVAIFAGTNDSSRPQGVAATEFAGASPITGQAPGTILNVAKAIRYSCELLLTTYPDVQIILVTPLQRGSDDNTTIFNIGQVIKDCAGYLAVDVIDAGKRSGIYGKYDAVTHKYLYDFLHPNASGNKKIGAFMANELKHAIVV